MFLWPNGANPSIRCDPDLPKPGLRRLKLGDIMSDSSPSEREIAHLIAAILAARETPAAEVPQLMEAVRDSIMQLRGNAAAPARIPNRPTLALPIPETTQRELPSPIVRKTAAATGRRRGRPRRSETLAREPMRRPEPAPAAPPPAPRLMRRAEVAPAEAPVSETRRSEQTTLRGIVHWFDQRSRHGMLRLRGLSGDIAIDGTLLDKAGISRLYKGQEIEATIAGQNGATRLLAVVLPGRTAEPPSGGLFKAGSARRHARPVVVEMKRDSLRRAAARIEAEHVLGNVKGDREG